MPVRGVCRRVFKLQLVWEGSLGKLATAANRTREIRPSGMRGGLSRNVDYGGIVIPSHISKECESETPLPKVARAALPPDALNLKHSSEKSVFWELGRSPHVGRRPCGADVRDESVAATPESKTASSRTTAGK